MTQPLAERQVALYQSKIASNQKALKMIDSGKITYHEATTARAMRDVTAERRLEILSNIEAFEGAIRAWASAP